MVSKVSPEVIDALATAGRGRGGVQLLVCMHELQRRVMCDRLPPLNGRCLCTRLYMCDYKGGCKTVPPRGSSRRSTSKTNARGQVKPVYSSMHAQVETAAGFGISALSPGHVARATYAVLRPFPWRAAHSDIYTWPWAGSGRHGPAGADPFAASDPRGSQSCCTTQQSNLHSAAEIRASERSPRGVTYMRSTPRAGSFTFAIARSSVTVRSLETAVDIMVKVPVDGAGGGTCLPPPMLRVPARPPTMQTGPT